MKESLRKLGDIHFRDPFVLADPAEAKYYLYGSTGQNVWEGKAIGFDVYESSDLKNWKGPFEAFRPDPDFWADRHYWAPEVFKRGGRYYMFASFKSEARRRTTGVLVAEHPAGPFEAVSFNLTPADWECLDGTFFEDEEGLPWMVFCREWVQVQDGEMYAVRLTEDLTGTVGEPVLLFKASEASWSKGFGVDGSNYVTDGPFLHRMPSGQLLMLWSTSGAEGYTMGTARSRNGKITGPWTQDSLPLFSKDGGHGMLFARFDGQQMLTIHAPNVHPNERPIMICVQENNNNLQIMNPED